MIAHLQQSTGLPVWLIGTSRGTESAASVAMHIRDTIAGLALTSTLTVPTAKGASVAGMALGKIGVPTLLVAHEHDACWVTPPHDAAWIGKRLINAPQVTGEIFQRWRSSLLAALWCSVSTRVLGD